MQYQHSKNKVIIIFETNNVITKEDIMNAHGLMRKHCDIYTLDDIIKNPSIFNNYKCMVDCTFQNKIIKNYTNKKRAITIKEEFSYMRTPTNKFVIDGPNISQLTVTQFAKNDIMKAKFEENIKEYDSKINFIKNKIPEYKNQMNFNEAIKVGLDFTNFVNNKEKRYVLISEIPENKENGVVYITPNEIEILEKLQKIANDITF